MRNTLIVLLLIFSFHASFGQVEIGNLEKTKNEKHKILNPQNKPNSTTKTAFTPLGTVDGGAIGFYAGGYTTSIVINSGTLPPLIQSNHIGWDNCASFNLFASDFYFWQISTDGGITWLDDINSTSGLTHQPQILTQTTKYRRGAYSSLLYGCPFDIGYSNVITVNVVSPTVIYGGQITVSNNSICQNSSTTISNIDSAAGGVGTLIYQWQEKNSLSNFTDIPGANSIDFTTPNLINNTTYRRKTIDSNNLIAYSNEVTVSIIIPNATASIYGPSNITGTCNATLSYGGIYSIGNTFQWQKKDINNIFQNIAGATGSSYTVTLSGNYRLLVTNITCGVTTTAPSSPTSVTISNPIATATITNGSTAAGNCSVVLNASTAAGNSYQWQKKDNSNVFQNIVGATTSSYTATQTGDYRVYVNLNVCIASSDTSAKTSVVINPMPAVAIITNGSSASGACTVVLNALTATGNTYQWQLKDINNVFQNINGATSSTYSAIQSGYYRVVVTNNTCGLSIANSNEINVFLAPDAVPVQAIISNGSTAVGACTVTLNAVFVGSGSGYSYKWQLKDNSNIFQDIAGATGFSYTATKSGDYRLVVSKSNICGSSSSNSTPTTVTLFNEPAVATITNGSNVIGSCNAILTATYGARYAYQWQKKNSSNVFENIISGAGGINYTVTQSGEYRVVVTNFGCTTTTSTSSPTTVTLNGNNAIATITNGSSVTANCSITLNAATSTGNSYQWQLKDINNIYQNIAGATASSYTTSISGDYKVVVTNNTCGNSTASSLPCSVTINTITAIATIINGSSVSGACSVILNAGTVSGNTYQWQLKDNLNIYQNIAGASSSTYTATTSGDYRLVVTNSLACSISPVQSPVTSVVINTLNPGVISPSSQTINAGLTPSLISSNTSASGSNLAITYQWQTSVSPSGIWYDISGATNENYQPGVLSKTAYFQRLAFTSSCSLPAVSNIAEVIVLTPAVTLNPGIITNNNNQCITAGTQPALYIANSATGGVAPYFYQWQKNEFGVWSDIVGANAENYQPSILNVNTSFKRKVTDFTGTVAYTNEVKSNIQNGTLKAGLIDATQAICPSTSPGLIQNIIEACGGGGTLVYTWEINDVGQWNVIANEKNPIYNASTITSSTKFRRKVMDGCNNTAYSNEIEVITYPKIEAGTIFPTAQTVCSNAIPEKLSLMQNCHYTNGTVSYQWQKANTLNGVWTDIAGSAGTDSIYQPLVRAIGVTSYYRLKVSSTTCNAYSYSNEVSVTIASCGRINQVTPIKSTLFHPSNLSSKGNLKNYSAIGSKNETLNISFSNPYNNSLLKTVFKNPSETNYNFSLNSFSNDLTKFKLSHTWPKGTFLSQVPNNQ